MATAGPNAPSTNSGTWTNGGNAYTSNDVWTTVSVSAGSNSGYLYLQGFGFSLPAGSTVDGVTVAIERHAGNSGSIVDQTLYLLDTSGAIAGNNKADTGTSWPTSDGTATYGSSSDKWGRTMTETDINSANFGIGITVHNNAGLSRTAYIDYVTITVDYTAAGGQPMAGRGRQVPYMRQTRIGW